jgi:hypothetical protein
MIDFSNLIMQATQTLTNDALAIALGLFFGLASIAVAILFGFSQVVKDFLTESKKAQVDEKIAMLYNYAEAVTNWSNTNVVFPPHTINRMESDIRSIGRIRKSIKEMADYIAREALDFGMASPSRYRAALEGAGFTEVALRNRNPWYREVARKELALLEGPGRATFEARCGAEEIARQIGTWAAMVVVLESGEHCPHHFRARKPLSPGG